MIIVTGGAGFIGSNILATLQQHGYHDLAISDWLGSDAKWKNIAKRELCAIIEPPKLPAFLDDMGDSVRAVIHMGAISTTTESDVDLIIRSNFTLSQHLWNFCARCDIPFIYASSAATYGDGSLGFKDDDSPEYLNALRPLNPYGWSKALFDRWVARQLLCNRRAPSQHVGLKFFNVYGPNEYHKGGQMSVVAHIFPDALANRHVKLFKSYNPRYEDGFQMRDFVWVGDIASVVLWMLEHPEVNGLFNVGSGAARAFHDLASATWHALDKEPQISYVEMPESLRDKYQYFTQADISKLRAAGYDKPMTSLEVGITTYVRNFLNTPDPYR